MKVSMGRLVALACLVLMAVAPVAIPAPATAAIGQVAWTVPVYQGYDSFYGSNVLAFTAGTTASVTIQVTNDQGVDVTIKEAMLTLDWGADISGTGPSTLAAGATGTFSFAVPVPASASNSVLHSYQVKVGYQRQDASYVVTYQAGQMIGSGNGATLQFDTASHPILVSSLIVYWRDTIPIPEIISLQDPVSYSVDALRGRITFGTAPPVGTQVYVDYRYFQSLGAGNGVKTVFYTGSHPVVYGSLVVCVGNQTTETFVTTAGWTADYETGKITMAFAPTSFDTVYATYESWVRWPVASGANLAVYSADQAGAMASAQQYNIMNTNYPADLFAPGTVAAMAQTEASVLAAGAAVEYAAGNFASARTDYAAAVGAIQSAVAALVSGMLPAATTDNAGSISANSARLNGSLASLGSADNVTASFVWGTSPGTYNCETTGQVMSGPGGFYFDLGGLTPGTTYYYKAKAVGNGTGYGADNSLTTLGTPPAVATSAASVIGPTSATLNGSLPSLGTASSVQVSFEWGLSASYGSTSTPQAMTAAGAFSANPTGLTASTTYHFRAKAAGDGSPVYGDDITLTTPGPADTAAPVISAPSVQAAGARSTITWTTDEAATSQVEYGLTEEYGSITTPDSSLVTSHSVELTGLKDGQAYHYRVVSRDAANNEAVSADGTLTTAPEPGGGMPAWAWTIMGLTAVGAVGTAAFLLGWRIARH